MQLINKKIAYISSPQLGDSLLGMTTVNNLQRNDCDVTVFGDYLYALHQWFPDFKINPAPRLSEVKTILENFDLLIYTYRHDIIGETDTWHPNVIVLADSPLYKLPIRVLDIQLEVCKHILNLHNLVRDNGLVPLPHLIRNKYPQRVIIHPSSRQAFRSWHAEKFVTIVHLLKKHCDCAPYFVVSPSELKDWLWLEEDGLNLLKTNSIHETAQFIYESGFFLGNDSGIGHLASNLGLPTITLAMRPGLARQWRPSFAPNIVLFPPKWLITRCLKEKYWRDFISVSKAYKALKTFIFDPSCINPNYVCFKNFNTQTVCVKNYFTPEMQQLIAAPDKFMEQNLISYLKNDKGDTTTVAIVNLDGKKILFKRYNFKGIWYYLKNFPRRSRALRSWLNSHLLLRLNIPTAKPIAIIEEKFGFLKGKKSYFISEYLEGENGDRYFNDSEHTVADIQKHTDNIVSIINKFKDNNLTHGDLRYGNMIISKETSFIVDLDHVKHYHKKGFFYRRAWRRDLKTFSIYLANNPTVKEMFCAKSIR